ncbi:MAG: response regulator [Prevotella sp.]|nr:response regulator [Prevotella sp.]
MKKQIAILLVILSALAAKAQPKLHFEHLNTKGHGIFCSFRDADGVVWLGTSNGLTTFAQLSGNYPFSYYRSYVLKEIINKIEQDNLGRLWLQMQSGQDVIYDAAHNTVISDIEGYLRDNKLPSGVHSKVTIDHQGRVWIGDQNALAMRDFKTSQTHRYQLNAADGPIEKMKATDKDVYVVTRHKLYAISLFTWKIRLLSATPEPMIGHEVFLSIGEGGDIWVANMNALYRLDPSTHQWRHYPEVKLMKTILPLPAGSTCVATSNDGLYMFDKEGNMSRMQQAPPNTDGLLSNHIENVSFDNQRSMLVISYNKRGMSLAFPYGRDISFNHLSTADNQYQSEDIISVAVEAGGKSFWVGTEDNGVFRLTLDNKQEVLEHKFEKSTVTALLSDSKGQLWTGVYGSGLVAPDGRVLMPLSSPYCIVEPIPGGRIFTALLGQGIYAIDRQTGEATLVETDSPWPMKLSVSSDGGKVYTATSTNIYEIDARTLKSKPISTSVFGDKASQQKGFRDLHVDSRGWVWLISNVNHSPLFVYNLKTGTAIHIEDMSRYISHAICEDKNGNMWVSTDKGMVGIKVDATGKSPTFTTTRVFYTNNRSFFYNDRALAIAPNDRLIAGSSGGCLVIAPYNMMNRTKKNVSLLMPIITQIRVNGAFLSSVETKGGKHPASTDVIYAKYIELESDENDIVLECLPRGYDSEFEGQFLYFVEGYTDGWVPMDNYTITLPNMRPGDYELLVRYETGRGDANQEYTMLHIHIKQPFWKSPLGNAIIAFFLTAIASSIYLIVRNRRRITQRLLEVERQKEQDEKLNEMKMNFYTNVSHDLRTPLTLIIAPIEELIDRFRNRSNEAETLSTLSIVQRNAHRLLGMVNQLLDMRRMESTDNKLNLVTDDVALLVSDVAEAFRAQARARSIDLKVNVPQEGLFAEFDKEKLLRVLNNLISNSFKFTPDGGFVTVDCLAHSDDTTTEMELKVADNGAGIPAEDLPHIFERFYTSQTLNINHQSSGIGLHIVKLYVELMGGTITMSNNQPHGTVAHIVMPLKLVATSAPINTDPTPSAVSISPVQPSTEPESGSSVVAQQPPTSAANLLLVEDNADLLNFMSTSLSDTYNIYTATNGEEALALLADEQPIDVIVTDIMMPVMDGLELTRRIKNNVDYSHIPVILLTAKALEQDEMLGLQMGANDYITKPFNIEILRLRISSWMQRRLIARNRFSNQSDVTSQQLTITTLDQQLLERAINVVTENMHNADFNVDQLAAEMGIHRTGLNRKLQFITGQTPILFIRTLRLKRARQLIENDPTQPISQVAYQVGFNNPKIFTRYFYELFNEKPSAFAQQLKKLKNGSEDASAVEEES